MELVEHLVFGMQVGKDFPESLKGLKVHDVRRQPVPFAERPRIK